MIRKPNSKSKRSDDHYQFQHVPDLSRTYSRVSPETSSYPAKTSNIENAASRHPERMAPYSNYKDISAAMSKLGRMLREKKRGKPHADHANHNVDSKSRKKQDDTVLSSVTPYSLQTAQNSRNIKLRDFLTGRDSIGSQAPQNRDSHQSNPRKSKSRNSSRIKKRVLTEFESGGGKNMYRSLIQDPSLDEDVYDLKKDNQKHGNAARQPNLQRIQHTNILQDKMKGLFKSQHSRAGSLRIKNFAEKTDQARRLGAESMIVPSVEDRVASVKGSKKDLLGEKKGMKHNQMREFLSKTVKNSHIDLFGTSQERAWKGVKSILVQKFKEGNKQPNFDQITHFANFKKKFNNSSFDNRSIPNPVLMDNFAGAKDFKSILAKVCLKRKITGDELKLKPKNNIGAKLPVQNRKQSPSSNKKKRVQSNSVTDREYRSSNGPEDADLPKLLSRIASKKHSTKSIKERNGRLKQTTSQPVNKLSLEKRLKKHLEQHKREECYMMLEPVGKKVPEDHRQVANLKREHSNSLAPRPKQHGGHKSSIPKSKRPHSEDPVKNGAQKPRKIRSKSKSRKQQNSKRIPEDAPNRHHLSYKKGLGGLFISSSLLMNDEKLEEDLTNSQGGGDEERMILKKDEGGEIGVEYKINEYMNDIVFNSTYFAKHWQQIIFILKQDYITVSYLNCFIYILRVYQEIVLNFNDYKDLPFADIIGKKKENISIEDDLNRGIYDEITSKLILNPGEDQQHENELNGSLFDENNIRSSSNPICPAPSVLERTSLPTNSLNSNRESSKLGKITQR